MNLRISSLAAVITAALLVSSTAPAKEGRSQKSAEALAKALADRTAGVPVNCISERSKMQVIDDWTILFRDRSIIYLQRPIGGCHGLSNNMSLIRNAFGTTRICSGDINRIVDVRDGFGTGACTYSEFIPYRKAS
jgi:hypothetical protein